MRWYYPTLSSSVMFLFVGTFSEKMDLTTFQKILFSLTTNFHFLATKFVIMSFLAFLTSFTQRLRCALFAFLYSSGLQRRNLFLNFDLVIISFFLQKRMLIYPGIFLFFWEHDSLVTFYMHQRNQSVYEKP